MTEYKYTPAFLRLLAQTNLNYESEKGALQSLITAASNKYSTVQHVSSALLNMTQESDSHFVTKANKYKHAIWFLQNTYPGLQQNWISTLPNNSKLSQAAKFNRKDMPSGFNKYVKHDDKEINDEEYRKQKTMEFMLRQGSMVSGDIPMETQTEVVDRLETSSRWLNQSVEEYLYTTNERVGVILIHLGTFQKIMETEYDGWSTLSHMKSTLRAASIRGFDVCILHLKETSVFPQLDNELDSFKTHNAETLVDVVEMSDAHMGGRHEAFRKFARRQNTVVVMGFDANVCVRANLFGTNEYYDDKNTKVTAPPITSLANVVTSRSLLVSRGVINNMKAYGVLAGI